MSILDFLASSTSSLNSKHTDLSEPQISPMAVFSISWSEVNEMKVTQSHLTFCNLMDYTVYGILQEEY